MSILDILTDIVNSYASHKSIQSDIAKKYNASRTDISNLLQYCGFKNSKIIPGANINVNQLINRKEIRELCQKILDGMP